VQLSSTPCYIELGSAGTRRVYLYTSGTLPEYYTRLGWQLVERLQYLGRERTVMDYDLGATRGVSRRKR
jgi:hypothetical protein